MSRNEQAQVTHYVGDRCPGGHYDEPEAVIMHIDCIEAALQDTMKRLEEEHATLQKACRLAGIAYGPDAVMRMAEALRAERRYKRTGAYARKGADA